MQRNKVHYYVCSVLALLSLSTGYAKVGVIKGVTPIDQGMAIHADDFTIYNDNIAVSFAVGSNNYWNMTSGSILDVAIVKDGKFGTDLTNDVEFLNDLWTATGAFNGENLLNVPIKDIGYQLFDDKVIVTAKTRYWTAGHKLPLNVTIEYTLKDGKNYIAIKTIVENPKGNDAYTDMYSGYSLSTLASNMFGPFGYYPDLKITGIGIGNDQDVQEKYGEFVVTYGKNYAVSMQLDGANAYKGSSGYKDLYIHRTINGGETYVYTGELLISDRGETAPIIERYLEKDIKIPAAQLQGVVKDSKGQPVSHAYVIVSKKSGYKETIKSHGKDVTKKDIMQPFVWKIADKNGVFDLKLPQDEYQIHIEAEGYTPSDAQTLILTKNENMDFTVNDGAKVEFKAVDQNNDPVNFKVTVSGVTSTVKTLGGTVFFTDSDKNITSFDIAAPKTPVTFTFTRAHGFNSLPVSITKTLKPGELLAEEVQIPTLIDIKSRGWYNMDNHQHSDIGDGATPIGELYKAQVAADLDFVLVADHDSVVNNPKMAELAQQDNRLFLSNIEVSPGWGHWGILGMDYSQLPISPNLTPADIIKEGHKMGAVVIVHHPYSDYGYLNNRDGVKGGFDEGSEEFDLLELQSTLDLTDDTNMDKKALDAAMRYWNQGVKKYLSAGSDQHDVTSNLYPGIIRMYVYLGNNFSVDEYLKALKEGRGYVSMGPIIFPADDSMFGSVQTIAKGKEYLLSAELQSVYGIGNIKVYSEGQLVAEQNFNAAKKVDYQQTFTPQKSTWYNLVVQDSKGHYAVTNPIWVNVK